MAEVIVKLTDVGNTVVMTVDSTTMPDAQEPAPQSVLYSITLLHLIRTGKMEELTLEYLKESGLINEQSTI